MDIDIDTLSTKLLKTIDDYQENESPELANTILRLSTCIRLALGKNFDDLKWLVYWETKAFEKLNERNNINSIVKNERNEKCQK